MASYIDMAIIAEQPSTRSRVEYCLKKAAVAVMAEADIYICPKLDVT